MSSLGLQKCKRVIWRLQEKFPKAESFTQKQVETAIMHECGTSPSTIRANIDSLLNLNWMERNISFKLTDNHKD